MKIVTLRYLTCFLIISLAICSVTGTKIAEAASSTTTQTVTITFPPIRALYLDKSERIVAIFSNTPTMTEERLQAFKCGVEIPISDKIIYQYKELLPIADWSKTGWVYQQWNPKPELPEEKWPEEKPAWGTSGHSEEVICKDITIEFDVCEEEALDEIQELKSSPPSPPSPHKGNYVIRTTFYDVD